MAIHAVVMAGGHGERFWPLSTAARPKQFVPFDGERTLFQSALVRAGHFVTADRIWVSGSREHEGLLCQQGHAHGLVPNRLILEPARRDTAPGVGLAALRLYLEDPDAVMVMMPSDHFIGDDRAWLECVRIACEAARSGALVTIGLRPTRPETGYGYIELGDPWEGDVTGASVPVHRVAAFREKPDESTAWSFFQGGRHLWNSGMFVWQVRVILDAIRRYQPDLGDGLDTIAAACNGLSGAAFEAAWQDVVERIYPDLPRVSIDYAVMEKADNILVVRGDFPWDDIGNWGALERIRPADAHGNTVSGRAVTVDTRDSVIYNETDFRLVAYGLRDALLVATKGVLVVAEKDRAAEWKQLLSALREQGMDLTAGRPAAGFAADDTVDGNDRAAFRAWLEAVVRGGTDRVDAARDEAAVAAEQATVKPETPRVVEKPWGREIWWAVTDRYAGKILQVNAGHALSLQYHERKAETQLFLYGSGVLELDGTSVPIVPGLCRTILPRQVHRIVAETDLALIEVSTPELDDVVRLEDRYGRTRQP